MRSLLAYIGHCEFTVWTITEVDIAIARAI